MKRTKEIECDLEKLTEKQRLFCYLYLTDRECFGNASKSYMVAYNLSPRHNNAARVSAHQNLTKPNILAYMNMLLDENMSTVSVEREHCKLILQDKDLPTKMKAIKLWYRLKNRVKTVQEDIKQCEQIPMYIHYGVSAKTKQHSLKSPYKSISSQV